MSNIYFISDIHLVYTETEDEKKKREKLFDFFEFLASEGKATELYILGDLFDFWFEWYHTVPRYWFPVLYRLKKLIESGVMINFVTGNHDFYTGEYLEKEVGIRCFNEFRVFNEGAKRFFVAHGDGYAKEDRGYRFVKRIIRHPASIFLFKSFIPGDWGMALARLTSRSSRKWVQIEKDAWSEEYCNFAAEKFKEGFDYVILGHVHYPIARENEQEGKTYINTGDWITHFSYGHYDGERLMLKFWDKNL